MNNLIKISIKDLLKTTNNLGGTFKKTTAKEEIEKNYHINIDDVDFFIKDSDRSCDKIKHNGYYIQKINLLLRNKKRDEFGTWVASGFTINGELKYLITDIYQYDIIKCKDILFVMGRYGSIVVDYINDEIIKNTEFGY